MSSPKKSDYLDIDKKIIRKDTVDFKLLKEKLNEWNKGE